LSGNQFDELERTVAGARSLERGFFQPEAVKQLFAEHRSGARDNGNRIWRLLNLELWQRVFVDRDPALLGSSEFVSAASQRSAGLPG
jgi:asparagine synthase (glutamine-hydrolysing)